MKFCEIRRITIKETTGYNCQEWNTKNSQINHTKLYPINHVSQNCIKKTLISTFILQYWQTPYIFVKQPKCQLDKCFNVIKMASNCVISVTYWWMRETVINCSGWKQIWFSYSQQKIYYIEQKFIEESHSESCFFSTFYLIMKCKWRNQETFFRELIKINLCNTVNILNILTAFFIEEN